MQIKKRSRLLALALAVLILSTYFPIQAFAKEEYDSYDLEELKFYIGDEEVSMEEAFFRDKYSIYHLNLPRETREIKVKAVPVTKNAKVEIYDGNSNWYDISSKNDYTTKMPFKASKGFESYDRGFERTLWIRVTPHNPPEVSWKPQYIVSVNIAGYPEPEIKGTKKQFVFEQHQEVTKEELLKGVIAIDELDGDITDEIEIILYNGRWFKEKFDTRFLENGEVRYRVENSHGRVVDIDIPFKIVKEKLADLDTTPPEFYGIEPKTFYVGETVDKAKLLEGITAIDDVDGDITDKIEVTPDSIKTDKSCYYFVTYTVKDKAGNKTEKRVKHTIIEKPIEQSDKEKRIRDIIKSIAPNYYGTGEDWEAIDLAIYGKRNFIHKETLLTKAQQVIKKNPKKATEYERIAISLTAAGFDARKIPVGDGTNIDLIEKIANHEEMGTLNDYIWALLAYDSGNYPVSKDNKWTRKDLIDYMLKKQLSDGSWSLTNELGPQLDVDITAMTISALAPYKEEPKVGQALEKAVDALGRVKTKDYCFIYGQYNEETSESSSMVLIALASMGIDPNKDPRFSGETKSIIDGQLSFVTEQNFFKHVKVFVDGYIPAPNALATEQGFRALVTYVNSKEKGYEPYYPYQFDNYGGDKEDPEDIVTLRELNILNVPRKTRYEVGDKTNLDGLKVEAVYSNGKKEIVPNSKLSLCDFDTKTSGYKKVLVKYGGLTTNFTIIVEDLTLTDEVTAKISVIDPKGKTYFSAKDLKIKEGEDTAFSLLQKTGLTYEYNYHAKYEGVYVSSIEGLAEFDGGPNSGWMYRVNGEFPGFSSSFYKLKNGDRVEWLYTTDLGKDIGGYLGGETEPEKSEKPEKLKEPIKDKPIEAEIPTDLKTEEKIKTELGEIKISPKSFDENIGKVKFIAKEEDSAIEIKAVDEKEKPVEIKKALEVKVKFEGKVKNKDNVTAILIKDDGTKTPVGGVYDEKTKTIKFLTNECGKFIVEEGKKEFKDTSNVKWAKTEIESMAVKGIIEGKPGNIFDPNANISRAEFAVLASRMLKLNENVATKSPFKDISKGEWYYDGVVAAYENSIIKGKPGQIFDPTGEITREEIVKIIGAILKEKGYENKDMSKLNKFKDSNSVSSWAKEEAALVVENGIIAGNRKGEFMPKAKATRAEVATMLYRLYNLIMR